MARHPGAGASTKRIEACSVISVVLPSLRVESYRCRSRHRSMNITPGYVACNVACSAGRAYRGVPAGVILDGTSVVARLIFQHGEEREDHGAHGEGFIRALRAKRIDPTSVALCGFTFLGALCVKPAFLTQARSSMISYQPPKSIIHKNARSRLPLNGRSRRWRAHRGGGRGYGDNARGIQ
jgi:hypothetical protein